jgi:methionyl-tRNA synthetase
MDSVDSEGNPCKRSKVTGNILTWVVEENYKFKLSQYLDDVLKWIQREHPIRPEEREHEVVQEICMFNSCIESEEVMKIIVL